MSKRKQNNITLNVVKGLTLALLLFTSHVISQPFTDEEKKILEMQDKRNISTDYDWLSLMQRDDYKIRYRILYSLFNTNTNEGYSVLKKLYQAASPDNKVDLSLIFSGYDTDSNRMFLINEIANESNDIEFRKFLIPIYSKVADSISFSKLTSILNSNPNLGKGLLGSEKYFSIRKVGTTDLVEQMYQVIIDHKYNNDFFAYALNRYNQKPYLTKYKNFLIENTQTTEYTTRMWSFSAIGKLQDTADVRMMLTSLADEKDWRVRVNIITSLGNYKIDNTSPLLGEVTSVLLDQAVNGGNTHVSIVALQALAKLFAGADPRDMLAVGVKEQLLFLITPGKAVEWQVKAEAIKTYAKIFKDEARADLFAVFSQTDNYDIKAAAVNAMGSMNDAMVYKELRDSISADVMRYNAINPNKDGSMIGSPDLAKMYKGFVEALAELDDRLDNENRNTIRLIFSEFASSKNAPIVDICLTNLQDSMYLQYRTETCQIMMFDYAGFKYPQDKDVTIMYIETWGKMGCTNAVEQLTKNLKNSDYDIAKASADALKLITGKDYEKEINAPKYKHDFDWKFIDNLKDKKFASVQTNKGTIVIELTPEIAPFTVQSFVKLSEKGFYNNTIFHRVVPNFVIQGGDPTGSGYGGPGYSIRSEFSPLSYEAYTVGMASSGKDTEGSQFFITHSPQPHLDGRYTIFGNVVDGFDVVDNIQIGDKIESISFSSSR